MTNDYSGTWFETFLRSISSAQTEAEVDFVAAQLPQPLYESILDLCCGPGRHARALAARGYQVTGVERDADIVAEARRLSGSAVTYIELDMRRLADLPDTYDAVVCLWQSFGYFDEATNRDVLRQIHAKLNQFGRLILDIYHREFFERHQDTRASERDGRMFTESKQMRGNRLSVTLHYSSVGSHARADLAVSDRFEWQLFTPDELRAAAESCGFECILACTGFDASTPPSAEQPRMQFVLQKR